MEKNNIEEVLIHHLTAFGNNDLDAILKDYTETSLIFTPKGIVKGLDNIRQFFVDFFALIPTGSTFGMDQKLIEGNVAYILWNSDSNVAQIPVGTDSFLFEGNKIQYHTVADYRIAK
jgi:ketosteroid isomerase-like protein